MARNPASATEGASSQLHHRDAPVNAASGENTLDLQVGSYLRPSQSFTHRFVYDPDVPSLPRTIDWSDRAPLDVQDGQWEVFRDRSGEGWVRPVPGTEGWDRIIVASGAFPGGRRVRTRIILENNPAKRVNWGFGVFPLWGGQPDVPDHRPRRGWRFGLAWYSSGHGGVGTEFSEKIGDAEPVWVGTYRDLKMEAGRPYHVVTETWPRRAADGRLLSWVQRLKWWADGDPEPSSWLVVDDRWGAPLPDGEYGVTLFSLRAPVAFGPVRIEPLDPPE